MNIVSSARFAAVVLGLSFSAMACSQATADGGSSSAAAQTGPTIEPSMTVTILADGRSAADALVRHAASLYAAPDAPENAVFKDWLSTTSAADIHVDHHADQKGVTYYLEGLVMEEGDIVTGSKQLVIEERWSNPELGPSFSVKLGAGDVPATGQRLSGAEADALSAVAGAAKFALLAPNDPASVELKKFAILGISLDAVRLQRLGPGDDHVTITAQLTVGGDVIVGDAFLDLRATRDMQNPEFNIVRYTATAEVQRF